MKGEKGICLVGEIPNQIRRTKFDTKQNAQAACDMHVGLGFVSKDYIVYKCKGCDMYHFGKPSWAETYKK